MQPLLCHVSIRLSAGALECYKCRPRLACNMYSSVHVIVSLPATTITCNSQHVHLASCQGHTSSVRTLTIVAAAHPALTVTGLTPTLQQAGLESAQCCTLRLVKAQARAKMGMCAGHEPVESGLVPGTGAGQACREQCCQTHTSCWLQQSHIERRGGTTRRWCLIRLGRGVICWCCTLPGRGAAGPGLYSLARSLGCQSSQGSFRSS